MNTRTHTYSAPFVAKAQFLPGKLWFGKYQRFWFDSHKYSRPDAPDKVQFKDLKSFIDKNLIDPERPMISELTIFDNRQTYVNSESQAVNKYGHNIIFEWINGYVNKDHTLDLSFMDNNVSPDFLKSMLASLREPTQADIDAAKYWKGTDERPEALKNTIFVEGKNYGWTLYTVEQVEQRIGFQ